MPRMVQGFHPSTWTRAKSSIMIGSDEEGLVCEESELLKLDGAHSGDVLSVGPNPSTEEPRNWTCIGDKGTVIGLYASHGEVS